MKTLRLLFALLAALVALGAQAAGEVITLRADDAGIQGSARHVRDFINLNNTNSVVSWTTTVARAGTYRVKASVACASQRAGSEFEIRVGNQKANGEVPDTGGWYKSVSVDLGPVILRKAGPTVIEVRLQRHSEHGQMNLRDVSLEREE